MKEKALRSLEKTLGEEMARLNARTLGWRDGIDLLVIHDRNDREVAFDEGELIAQIANAKLIATEGLGHRRILKDRGVVKEAVSFFGREPKSLQAQLDEELFDRFARSTAA